ncbi:MAG: hypothetical protein JWR16_2485 [Nevskia sp.]|nr:hypothetical protein [Nevskia sp.]
MRNFHLRAPVTLPLDFEPRRPSARRRPPSAVRRATAMRNRGHLARTGLSEEQLGTWLIQGGIIVTMLAMIAFFRVPLMTALGSWF